MGQKDNNENKQINKQTTKKPNKNRKLTFQYQDDINELNEMAKHRPRSTLVMGLAQENRQIRELQQEKQELQMALEEHQSALQLIMHKYRQHTVNLLRANHLDGRVTQQQVRSKEEICQLLDKVEEMAGVMQRAVRMDDEHANHTQELIARLELENKTLRQMLEVCTTAHHPIVPAEASFDISHHNTSLDSSCSSQVSQIEVKPSAGVGMVVEDRIPEGEAKHDSETKS